MVPLSKVQLKVRVDEVLRDTVQSKLEVEGKSMSKLVEELLEAYLHGRLDEPKEEVKFTQQAEPKEEVQLTSPVDDKYKKYGSGADLMRILDEADEAYWEE